MQGRGVLSALNIFMAAFKKKMTKRFNITLTDVEFSVKKTKKVCNQRLGAFYHSNSDYLFVCFFNVLLLKKEHKDGIFYTIYSVVFCGVLPF